MTDETPAPVNGHEVTEERPMKWAFIYEPMRHPDPKAPEPKRTMLTFDSTLALVAFLVSGVNVSVPGAFRVEYIEPNEKAEATLGEIVNDKP